MIDAWSLAFEASDAASVMLDAFAHFLPGSALLLCVPFLALWGAFTLGRVVGGRNVA